MRTIIYLHVICLLVKLNMGKKKEIRLLGLVPDSGNIWPAGETIRTASDIALKQINTNTDILGDYEVKIHWKDTQCKTGRGLNSLFEHLYEDPNKLLVFGPGCSTVCGPTSLVTQSWNLTMLSYSCQQQSLSDRVRFPNFFRTVVSGQVRNPSLGHLFQYLGWRKIGFLAQSYETFTNQGTELVYNLEEFNATLMKSEIFQTDALKQLNNIKKSGTRIIVALMYEDKARETFCQAYELGLFGPKIVWVLPSWYGKDWYKSTVRCTVEEILEVVDGSLYIGPTLTNPLPQVGIGGMDPAAFEEEFLSRFNYSDPFGSEFAPSVYDGLWAVALALNKTDLTMKQSGYKKTLDQFAYEDKQINELIQQSFYEIEFMGIRGWTQFDKQGNPFSIIKIKQQQGGDVVPVGLIHPPNKDDTQNYRIEWINEGIKWRGGTVPKDGAIVFHKELFVSRWLYICMSMLGCVGIACAIVFLSFNVYLRKTRIIKMSSPKLNNMILVGCMLAYVKVFLQEQSCVNICYMHSVRLYIFTLSFAITFGALFAKTWRVHRIMITSTKSKNKVVIKDRHLLLTVFALVLIDCIVLTIWQIVDPFKMKMSDSGSEISDEDSDVEIQYQICSCYSDYQTYFLGIIYGIQGLLLLFGVFLAWETKKVKVEVLNDSRLIGMCIYNVIVLTILGLSVMYLTANRVDISYGFTSACLIIGTTTTQYIIFIPKLQQVWRDKGQIGPLRSIHLPTVAYPSSSQITGTQASDNIIELQ